MGKSASRTKRKVPKPGSGGSASRAKSKAAAAAKAKPKKSEPNQSKPNKTTPTLATGDKAPAFRLPRDGGGTVTLRDFTGRTLVLFFYPRANTSGCTRESIDFSRLQPQFARAGADILGVSADTVAAQEAFKNKHNLTVALGSDESHAMLEAYGVWQEKSLYGRKFLGIVRTTVLIGPDQRIVRIWPKVTVDGHAEEVLAAVKAM